MHPLHSFILGLVEGFTEFLPISSTAHLILVSWILDIDQTSFVKTFEIAIQSGAILAVLVVYWRKFLDIEILKKIISAFIPTAIIGLILYEFVKDHLIGNISVVLWALGIGGLVLIIFEKYIYSANKLTVDIDDINIDANDSLVNNQAIQSEADEIRKLSYFKAILIGVAQAMAIIPGVSRSAATIVGGLLIGMSRMAVVEFSFLLAVPTIGAATALDLFKNANLFTADQITSFIIGFVAAFVTAILGIKFLLSFVKGRTFVGFGIYRVVLAIIFALMII